MGTEPSAPVPDGSWKRESSESERWSPMTHTCPAGTVMSKFIELGRSPGLRYGSVISTSLTISLRFSEQQTTWSPGMPMTRLMRWSSDSAGSRPTNTSPSWIAPETPLRSTGGATSSQPPGSWKTTTSPCSRSTGPGVSFETMTRSPTRRVSSIDPEGMKKACSSQVFTTKESTRAMTTTTTTSRTAAVNSLSVPCGAGSSFAMWRPSWWAESPSGSGWATSEPSWPSATGSVSRRAHGATSGTGGTVPNRLSGQTRSTTVPTTASRGTVDATGAVRDTASGVEVPTTASSLWAPMSTCSRSAADDEHAPDDSVGDGGRAVDRGRGRRVDDDEVTGVGRGPHLPHEDTVSWFDGRRERGRGDEVRLEDERLHQRRGDDRGPEEHDQPGTTRPGLGHGGGRCRVGVGSGGHPAEPSRAVWDERTGTWSSQRATGVSRFSLILAALPRRSRR